MLKIVLVDTSNYTLTNNLVVCIKSKLQCKLGTLSVDAQVSSSVVRNVSMNFVFFLHNYEVSI